MAFNHNSNKQQAQQPEQDFSDDTYLDSLGMNDDDMGISGGMGSMGGQMPNEQNLIEWQLDFTKDLSDIKMYLSGYKEGYDEAGNWTYLKPANDEEVPFNEFGVSVIMGHIRAYLNRNTVLSNYDSKRIKKILFDLGNRLSDEIDQTYEMLGMDTDYKKRRYPLIVMNILHMVESAYNRSLSGGERESLRTARTVNQSEPLGGQRGGMGSMGGQQKRSRWYKPSSWL